jgi:iron(III) transport system permease protein
MLGAVLAVAAIVVLLLATLFWLSFRDGSPGDPAARTTLANYATVFANPATYRVLFDTIRFSLVTLAVAMLFGVPAAWLAERTDLPAKPFLFTAMTIGLLIPGFAVAMGWLFLLQSRIGLINTWLVKTFALAGPPFDIATISGMGFVQGLNLAPVAFIMTAAVFRAMDPRLEEAAEISGAGRLATTWRITLGLAWPGLLAATIYIFTMGFAAFDVPAIIGWTARLYTFSTYLLLQLQPENALPRFGAAAALSSCLILLAAGLSWGYGRMQREASRYHVVTGKAYRPTLIPLGRGAVLAWAFLSLYFLLSLAAPLLLLIWASLLPYFQMPSAAAFASLSLDRFAHLPLDLVLDGLRNTLLLMVLAPTLTLAISIAFSWVILRSRIRGRQWFDFIAFLPHAVPSIIFGVSALLFALFVSGRTLPLFGTPWLLLLVIVVARISYATRMTNSGFIQIHRELEEAAQICGATTGAVTMRIIVPLIAPTLIYAWLWLALLAFRELTLVVVITTRDNITLPVVIWSSWLSDSIGESAALALLMLALMTPVIAGYWVAVRRWGMPRAEPVR